MSEFKPAHTKVSTRRPGTPRSICIAGEESSPATKARAIAIFKALDERAEFAGLSRAETTRQALEHVLCIKP